MLIKPIYFLLSFSLLSSQGSYNLYSPEIELPDIGGDETMHFGFWLHSDMPDFDGDNDDYLEDYYSISILDVAEYAWHSSDFNIDNGNNFWCADEEVSGYLDSWIQYLDTPSISVGNGGEFSSRIYYAIEDVTGPFVDGSCADGWDAANIRISIDGGSTWVLLEDPLNPYDFDCGYGWIYNDVKYEEGGSLSHLAKGWGDKSGGWLDFSSDLTDYAGENVIIRFAFGSDPAWSTVDDILLTGFQVDDVSVSDDSGVLFTNNGDDFMEMTASGEVWISQFYDYGSEEEDRPGSAAWEGYFHGMAFNGNVFMDISNFAEKTVQFRIQSNYDDNHDGGQGYGLFIDDFMIYKLSLGAYFSPSALNAVASAGEVMLSWENMNASGTDDFIYDNGVFELENTLYMSSAWVGEWFDVKGPSTVNSIEIFNSISNSDTAITIQAYGMYGETFDIDPLHSMLADVSLGWTTVVPVGWEMNNPFIIAYEINGTFGGVLDTTAFYNRSVINYGGTWKNLSEVFEPSLNAEFGLRANITYAGAGVTYNVYRDDANIASALAENTYTDSAVENNITYEYAVSATYSDGGESALSVSDSATPMSITVHEEGYDDGTSEVEFYASDADTAAQNNFSAVKFTANESGEEIVRFRWYQNGSGGTFYIKVFEDDGGMPGAETYSAIQASSSNTDGWNDQDLTSAGLNVSGDFWIGTKEFSSSKSFGLDTSSDAGHSLKRIGEDGNWEAVAGNLMYRVLLDPGEGAGRVISNYNNTEELSLEKYPVYSLKWENKKLRRVPLRINGSHIYNQVNEPGLLGRRSIITDTLFILNIYDFEDANTETWTHDAGWNLTTSDYYSPSHSFNSPNIGTSGCTIGYDCEGICGGSAVEDECGVCGGSGQPEHYDCNGNCIADIDCTGVCGGSSTADACGICGGTITEMSECGAGCTSTSENLNQYGLDCNGLCGGSAVEDECGVCAGIGSPEHYNCLGECTSGVDCNGACGGHAVKDDCEICNGNEDDGDVNEDGNICESLSIENIITPYYFGIDAIFPNPFNPIANIQFEISELTQAILSIYDLNGRLVNILVDDMLSPGHYTSVWSGVDRNGIQVSSGIYLSVLEAKGREIQTRKLVLLK